MCYNDQYLAKDIGAGKHNIDIIIITIIIVGLDSLSRYSDSLRVWRSGNRIRPDRHWGPPSLLYNVHRVFPGGKAAGAWRWPSTHT